MRQAGSIGGLLGLAALVALLWTLPAATGSPTASASAHDAHIRTWERPGSSDWTHGYDDNGQHATNDDGHQSGGTDDGNQTSGDDGNHTSNDGGGDVGGQGHGIPEPGTLALFAVGFAGLALSSLTRRRVRVKA